MNRILKLNVLEKDTAPIEIEKENHPQQNGDATTTTTEQPVVDCQMVVSETQPNNEPPSTPKTSNNKSMTTPKSGRKRTREEIEVAKAEKEKKLVLYNDIINLIMTK